MIRTLNDNLYLDAVMDGVTGRRGWRPARHWQNALAVAPLTSPADLLAVLEDVNNNCTGVAWDIFADDDCRCALCESVLHIVGAGDSLLCLYGLTPTSSSSAAPAGFRP